MAGSSLRAAEGMATFVGNVQGARQSTQGLSSEMGTLSQSANQTATSTGEIGKAAANGIVPFRTVKESLDAMEKAAGKNVALLGQYGQLAANANKPTSGLSGYLEDAATSAKNFASVNLAGTTGAAAYNTGVLAQGMGQATAYASTFLRLLSDIAGIPTGLFAGGAVQAGQSYKINDGPFGQRLGQESFLSSSGKLSMINRPANSNWVAPSPGIVIPASITARLKENAAASAARTAEAANPRIGRRGAGGISGQGGAHSPSLRGSSESDVVLAHLASQVGKLSRSIDDMSSSERRVTVQLRDRPGASELLALRRIHSLRR
jgi:hypothetical protein